MSGIILDADPFDDTFLENPFGSIFGPSNIFYSSSIFESQELLVQHNDFIDDHKYSKVESIPQESKTCLSLNPIASNVIGSVSKISATVEDTTMDAVQRPLMFEDEFILVAPYGKWKEHELDYLVFTISNVSLHPNPEKVDDVKYVSKEQRKLIRKAIKVKMKLHQQRKRDKYGPFSKKAKMKCFVVSLVET